MLGLRALFVLIEALLERFRYFDETIAIVLGVVAVKLLVEDLYKMPPELSLVLVLGNLCADILLFVLDPRTRETQNRTASGSDRIMPGEEVAS